MLAHLHALAKRYPNVPAALAELANLNAILTLPKRTMHVVSDVHGEYVKLRQVMSNASGSLRPLVDGCTADRSSPRSATIYSPCSTTHARRGWRRRAQMRAERREKLVWFVRRGHRDPGSRALLHAQACRHVIPIRSTRCSAS